MLLRPQIFMNRGIFQFYKVVKLSRQNVLRLGQIVINSGSLVSGCCFSRQSHDEDSLLSQPRKKNLKDINSKSIDHVHSYSDTENDKKSINMKRNFEFINNVVSQDSNVSEITVEAVDIQSKKRKIVVGETETDADVEIKLSNITSDSLSNTVIETTTSEKKLFPKTQKKEFPERLRPNYFVAVKVSNQKIHLNLKNIQNHILEKKSNLKSIMTELKTLHITLMVMYIGDTETHVRAMNALKSIHKEHDEKMSHNPLQLEFKGLGNFQHKVLYAKLSADDSYKRLCTLSENVKKHFADNLIFTTEKRKEFTPHLTVAKIDFKKKQNRFIKKIDPELYKEYVDQYLGSQTVESIQLLRMTGPKNEEGYYCGDELYFSAFDPTNGMNALCDLLEVEKKKKDIKEVINSLMKEKLK